MLKLKRYTGCFYEYELPLVGTAYEDAKHLKCLNLIENKEAYYVVDCRWKVVGGGGVKAFKGF